MRFAVALRPVVRGRVPAFRPRRTRARAAVLCGLLLFAGLQVGLNAAVDTARPQWRDPEFFHRYRKMAAVLRWEHSQPAPRTVVAVVGSSRPQMGFSPAHAADGFGPGAPVIFNLCQSGCQPIGERLNVDRILAGKLRPDFVLIEVMPSSLTLREPMDEILPVSRLSRADLACVTPYLSDPAAVRGRWRQAHAAPWYTHRQTVLAHHGLESLTPAGLQQNFLWADMQPNGWSPFYPADWSQAERERRQALALTWFADALGNFELSPRVAACHRDLLAACRANGLPAALFLMPESPTFRTLYSADARRQLRAYLAELSGEFGVPVFDGLEWMADDAFMDGYHLLGPGAEAFSRRFGRDCLRGWVPSGERGASAP